MWMGSHLSLGRLETLLAIPDVNKGGWHGWAAALGARRSEWL